MAEDSVTICLKYDSSISELHLRLIKKVMRLEAHEYSDEGLGYDTI